MSICQKFNMAEMRWLPLESNPDVMNKYAYKLGVPESWKFVDVFSLEPDVWGSVPKPVLAVLLLMPATQYVRALGLSKEWEFCDVFGLDPELLLMVPRPVVAVLLLYPLTEKSESEPLGEVKESGDVYFIKQTIGNACGTIGIINALCNNAEKLGFDSEKHLSKFFGQTKDMSPAERGNHLESDTAFGEAHEESAQEGQTEAPPRDEKVNLHFVAFVQKNGELFELDGRKSGPTCHGKTTEDTLLEDTAQVVKKFMARDPENLNFTVVALAKA